MTLLQSGSQAPHKYFSLCLWICVMAWAQLLSCCCLEMSLIVSLHSMSLSHNSSVSIWFSYSYSRFSREKQIFGKHAPVSHNPRSWHSIHRMWDVIISTAGIRQSTHRAPSSLPSYQHVDLQSRCCDTGLGTYGTQGWHCSALCSCSRGSGTWENSASGKNYQQNRQQAQEKQEILSIWHVTGLGNRERMKRRQCE